MTYKTLRNKKTGVWLKFIKSDDSGSYFDRIATPKLFTKFESFESIKQNSIGILPENIEMVEVEVSIVDKK